MPIFRYTCTNCSIKDARICAVSDDTAPCRCCGSAMKRNHGMAHVLAAYGKNKAAKL